MAHRNEEILRKGYAAFTSGDLDTIRALFADDIIWNVPGRNALSGTFKGKDEVFGWFAKLLTSSEGTFKAEVHDVLANDEHGVVIVSVTAQRGTGSLSVRGVDTYHMRDGKVTEGWFFNDDQYAEDEFWV